MLWLARALRCALRWVEGPAPQGLDIRKPPILQRMDEMAKHREVVELALRDLKERADTPLLDLGLVHAYVDAATEAHHLREDWFDPRSGWWSYLPAIEPVLREAFVAAGELMLDKGLPVDAYWLRGGEQFEIFLLPSERQLTILFVSPYPPLPPGFAAAKSVRIGDIKHFGPMPMPLKTPQP